MSVSDVRHKYLTLANGHLIRRVLSSPRPALCSTATGPLASGMEAERSFYLNLRTGSLGTRAMPLSDAYTLWDAPVCWQCFGRDQTPAKHLQPPSMSRMVDDTPQGCTGAAEQRLPCQGTQQAVCPHGAHPGAVYVGLLTSSHHACGGPAGPS